MLFGTVRARSMPREPFNLCHIISSIPKVVQTIPSRPFACGLIDTLRRIAGLQHHSPGQRLDSLGIASE